jgi:uncharacterized protein
MPQRADTFDLETLTLRPGDGRRIDLEIRVEPLRLGGQAYRLERGAVDARLDVSRTVSGYALRLRFDAPLTGPCMRCVVDASPVVSVDAREVDQPGEAEELHSPYVQGGVLELAGWAHDALALALPARILCRDDCRGLCAVCGADLNAPDAGDHSHAEAADPRWSKLKELEVE